jgi:hypothetical protein
MEHFIAFFHFTYIFRATCLSQGQEYEQKGGVAPHTQVGFSTIDKTEGDCTSLRKSSVTGYCVLTLINVAPVQWLKKMDPSSK